MNSSNKKQKLNHHYVPKSIINKFKNENGEFFVYDLNYDIDNKYGVKKPIYSKKSAKSIFNRYKDNTIVDKDGIEDNNFVEDVFEDFEKKAGASVRKILKNQELIINDKNNIIAFIAIQMLRVPEARENIKEFLKSVVRSTIKILKENPEFSKFKEFNEGEHYNIDINHEEGLRTLMSLESMVNTMSIMSLTILDSHKNYPFILSSNPCSIIQFNKNNMNEGTAHLSSPDIEISMPISPHKCILLSWRNAPINLKLSKKDTININKRTAIFGKTEFISSEKNNKVFNFLEKYKEINITHRINVIPVNNGQYTMNALNVPADIKSFNEYSKIKPILGKYIMNLDNFSQAMHMHIKGREDLEKNS
jgi:hypothetical protein